MKYRIDFHTHTQQSHDSRTTLEQAVAAAKAKGLSGLAITDHDVCAQIRESPYLDGILLIPGVEYSTQYGHLLGLFLEKQCDLQKPEHGPVDFSLAAQAIHSCGGLCILAHPYEQTYHTPEQITKIIEENAVFLDGIEIANCRAPYKRADANLLAAQIADRLPGPILRTAGSDAHSPSEIGGAWVTLDAPTLTLQAIREALKKPVDFTCGKCPHIAIAKSQLISRQKKNASVRSYIRWAAFAGLCVLRQVKGAIRK